MHFLHRTQLLSSIIALAFSYSSALMAEPNGQQLYTQHCSACHNSNGMGGIGLPLNTPKMADLPKAYLFKTIRNGRKGRVMPAFNKLSDIQVSAIVKVLQGWSDQSSPSYKQAKIDGDVKNGGIIFQKFCSSCHGVDGQSTDHGTGLSVSRERAYKVIPPALNNPGFLASASDEWIKHTIKIGRVGTIMPAHQYLTDKELNDVTHFIREFENQVKPEQALENSDPSLVFESPYNFETTVANLKQSLLGLNFAGFPDRYMEQGLTQDHLINKKQLSMRFCNFSKLYQFINTDPRLGIFLPCRFTVAEDDQGKVNIYMINLERASLLFNNDQLSDGMKEVQETIIEVIEESIL